MNKSLVYAVNSTTQNVGLNETISFGSPVRRCGCNCNVVDGTTVISGAGYYTIFVNLTFTGTDTGTASIALYKDGAQIPGAIVSRTTATSTTYCASFMAVVKTTCCRETPITAIVTGVPITVTNAAVEVIRE